jgi:putative tryptophan/tyrosine transport system substrate-binding protein
MGKQIGFLVAATMTAWQPYKKAFEKELNTKGWTIGSGTGAKDVYIDYEPEDSSGAVGAAGIQKTYATVANQFATNKVDVIVTAGTAAAQACQSATRSIPIVFASAGDPLGCGLVKSLTKPGGNLTGCSNMQTDSAAIDARINAMLTKMHPKPTKVGVIGIDNPPACPIDSALILAWSRIQNQPIPAVLWPLRPTDVQSRGAIKAALTQLRQQEGVDVLLVCSDPLVSANMGDLIQAAQDVGMQTMHEFREPVDQHHGDRSHGPSFSDLFIKAADMVDQILSGTSPGQIDVYQPPLSTFEDAPP